MLHTNKGNYLEEDVKRFVGLMMPKLNEKDRRQFLAGFAKFLGRGSAKELSELTGVSEATISKGSKELKSLMYDPRARPRNNESERIRSEGGGRKPLAEKDPEAVEMLLKQLDGNTLGDPMSLLTWTTRSTRNLSDRMTELGHPMSRMTVYRTLEQQGFSLQQNKKYMETGNPGPDRDKQFEFIKSESESYVSSGDPVISVDAKKKELIGNYANKGSEYRPKGDPRLTNDHDFQGKDGKAVPYGVYDVNSDEGYVSVGISTDTAEFAVNSIRSWWQYMGRERYPNAKKLMITADCGGSNGRRNRLWRCELQNFADETGLTISVRHFPPGTSKWNKIEHRMFSFISMDWRGQPLTSLELIVNLIGSTTTKSGLTIKCGTDLNIYEKGTIVSDEEINSLNITFAENNPEWNYTIAPREKHLINS